QHVSGLGITMLWTGVSLFSFRLVFGESKVQPSIDTFSQISLFGDAPVLGPIFTQYLLTYIGILLIPVVWWVIMRTRFGLQIRAVSENREAADAAGLNVYASRTYSLMIGGGLM